MRKQQSGSRWIFQPMAAIEVLTGSKKADIAFHRELNLFLLLIWMLWPDSPSCVRDAARILVTIITFSQTGDLGSSSETRLRDLRQIRRRLSAARYEKFYEAIAMPLGGLPGILSARSVRSFHALVRDRLCSPAIRAGLDLIDCAVKLAQYKPELATRAMAIQCITNNLYQVSDNYGISRGEKRKSVHPISEKAAQKYWDNSPPTMVLLYAFREKFPKLLNLEIHDERLVSRLTSLVRKKDSLNEVLALYELAMQQLEGVPNRALAFTKWRFAKLEVPINDVSMPRFSVDQIAAVERIVGAIATKSDC